MTTEMYDRVIEQLQLEWGPDNLPDGFISHHTAVLPDGIFIFDT